jgi:hypothetical protein
MSSLNSALSEGKSVGQRLLESSAVLTRRKRAPEQKFELISITVA